MFPGQLDPTVTSPASFPREPSPLSPLVSPSTSLSSPLPTQLKEIAPDRSPLSPPGPYPGVSRGSGLAEGVRERPVRLSLSPRSPEHATLSKRTRPSDCQDPSSPKTAGETLSLSKAKERSHSPQKAQRKTPEADQASKSRKPHPQKQSRSPSPRKSHGARQEVMTKQQHAERQQRQRRKSNETPSRESFDENANIKDDSRSRKREGRVGNGGMAKAAPPKLVGTEQRTGPEVRHPRAEPQSPREKQQGGARETGTRGTEGRSKPRKEEARETSKESSGKETGREEKSRKQSGSSAKEERSREDTVGPSSPSVQGAPDHEGQRGPISPGPWRVPSSVRILSKLEALRGPY